MWAVAEGVVKRDSQEEGEGEVDVVIDVPSGRVVARVAFDAAGEVKHVDFLNVASRQISAGHQVSVSLGPKRISLTVDLSFGGAVYASVDATTLGLSVEPANYQTFISLARQIKSSFPNYTYKTTYDLYGICFFSHLSATPSSITQRNVVVFADGQIDRSPCGSGTCARLAVLLAQGEVGVERRLVHESIVGTRFEAYVMEVEPGGEGELPVCVPRVRGKANLVGKMRFFIDERDPVFPGFVFR